MSIFRTIALFVYLFGYMIVHYSVLCKAERALAARDTETVRQLVKKHIPHWSKGILNVTGVRLSVEGLDNIPKDGPCVFVANHRSYYDIPLLLAGLDEPYGILAKEELGKIPLLNRWMSDNENNMINYDNPEYDAIMEKANTTTDDAEQTELYKQAAKLLTETAANVYIQDLADFVLIKSDLDGYQFYPLYVMDLSTVHYVQSV